jgi:hypothetical protein
MAQGWGLQPRWYLGFDCATKTFAFSLSRVDLAAFAAERAAARTRVAALSELLRRAGAKAARGDALGAEEIVARAAPGVAALDGATRAYVRIVDGETVDLLPGRTDADIPTVERLRALARYVARRVRPAVAAALAGETAGAPLCVLVEYQMGANARARAVAAALIALFAEEDVVIVGPTLKNKVAVGEGGHYGDFAQRYATSYAANKAHTKHTFAVFERTFGSGIPATRPPSLRGHIADSFMQVLGLLVHGGGDEEARKRF